MPVNELRVLGVSTPAGVPAIDRNRLLLGTSGSSAQDDESARKPGSDQALRSGSSPGSVWTVWADHQATGEGRTLMACIAYADDAEGAIDAFGRAFDLYFAAGAQAGEGVVENEVTGFLFSRLALADARSLAGRAHIDLRSSFHFNRS